MSNVEKVIALLDVLTSGDVAAMDPRRRRIFGALCRRAANLAGIPAEAGTAKAGVLASLRDGQRQE
ncbi:MAG: hypothetical protein ACREUF_03495 [Solimonas sp.]